MPLPSLILFGALALAAAAQPAPYDATAQFQDGRDAVYRASGTSKVDASQAALTACRMANPTLTTDCELIALNGEPLTTSAALKAQVATDRRPLYLWELNHGPSRMFIAGSIHMLKPGFYPLPPQFDAAFAQADELILEVTPEDMAPATISRLTRQHGFLAEGDTLQTVLPAPLYDKLRGIARELGIELADLHAMKPALVLQQLAVLEMMALGYDPKAGMEQHFQSRPGLPVAGLETSAFQLELLLGPPLPTQIALVEEYVRHRPNLEAQIVELDLAWLNGDDDAMRALVEAQAGETPAVRAFSRALLETRNVGMADKLEGYLGQPGTRFVLIGAAHLAGPDSVLALLQQRGFEATRLWSDTHVAPGGLSP